MLTVNGRKLDSGRNLPDFREALQPGGQRLHSTEGVVRVCNLALQSDPAFTNCTSGLQFGLAIRALHRVGEALAGAGQDRTAPPGRRQVRSLCATARGRGTYLRS